MRRALTMATVMSLAVLTGACSVEEDADAEIPENAIAEDTSDEDAAGTASDEEGMEVAEDPTCQGFFAGQGTPLAERAATQRDVVSSGDDLDPVAFSEVTLLSGRLMTLAEEADEDHAALLERINAPFEEVNDAVVEEGTRTEDVIAIPDVDVSDSEAAQTELEEACAA
ncbi:hypothetical protein [uncultured Serinicoccus sp.]|uniref:hypothetical protein n=1 Tax=uncultured Serinicoccus sp. TaxID=735514 RepID=UPI0026289BC3|nr:hypothetical protein [uncultured Serinicoccus sp.]